ERARSAVQLLCQFAKEGRQLLFFTCHDHIQQMFVEAEVDVRILPAHGQPGLKIEPYGAESPDEEMEDTESLDPELVDDEEEMEPYEVEADDACEIEEDEESHEIEAEADDETDQLVEEEEEHEIAIHLDEVVEEVEQVDERNKIEEITPEIDLTSFFRKKEVVVNSEPVVVEDVTMDKQLVKVDEVFNDLSDTQPFENGPWWWETSRGLPGDTKEENAA
ncbi:MAG: hypothetical protein QGG09_19340, partial [Pirellulaceae bacterium]|nr:hypothetical protein [Pirellulaceae bacterium]